MLTSYSRRYDDRCRLASIHPVDPFHYYSTNYNIYFGGKALGQEINLGIIAGNDVRMFVFSAMLFTAFIAPSSIMHNESLWDWGVDILIIILLSILTTRFFKLFIKQLIGNEFV